MKYVSPTAANRWLIAIFFATTLASCASGGGTKKAGNDYATLLRNAEAYVAAGRMEQALAGFNAASQADPTRKEPWLRSAQLQFDLRNYGRAIVAAEEVLKRDPNDQIADSVLTVSGLRVASTSLARLQATGALSSPTAQKEAKDLVTSLRNTMGAAFVTGEEPKTRTPPIKRPVPGGKTRPTAPAAQSPKDENPFD